MARKVLDRDEGEGVSVRQRQGTTLAGPAVHVRCSKWMGVGGRKGEEEAAREKGL